MTSFSTYSPHAAPQGKLCSLKTSTVPHPRSNPAAHICAHPFWQPSAYLNAALSASGPARGHLRATPPPFRALQNLGASGPPQGLLTALRTPPRHSSFAPLTQRVPLGVPSPPRGAAGIPPPLSIARWPLRPRLTPPCPPVPPRHLLAPKQRAGIEGSGRKETAHPARS